MSLTRSWMPLFASATREKGRAYHAQGRVSVLPNVNGEIIRARVQGNQNYQTSFAMLDGKLAGECTCPHFAEGHLCKHLWALLLELESRGFENPADLEALLEKSSPQPGKARKRSGAASFANKPKESPWIRQLMLLQMTSTVSSLDAGLAGGTNLPAAALQVCYVLESDLCASHEAVVISLQQRKLTKAGWSKPRRLLIEESQVAGISDGQDRELLGLLLGAELLQDEWSDPSGYYRRRPKSIDSFRLPRGAVRMLLEKMIATGRCYLNTGEHWHPLQWAGGEPWKLWLIGQWNGPLQIRTELRRGSEVLPIDAPAVVVGGAEGIVVMQDQVYLYDDRGASRWASMFREEKSLGTSNAVPGVMEIPTSEVEKFVERLYRLPVLPDLELPEDVGPREQKLPLVPVIAFTSAGRAEQEPAKALLSARVMMRYGEQQIAASQAGPFISGPDGLLIRRDAQAEHAAIDTLWQVGLRPPAEGVADDTLTLPARQLPAVARRLTELGWHVTADQRRLFSSRSPALSITTGIDWFEVRGVVNFETEQGVRQVSLPDILAAARAGKKTIQLDDGSEGLLPEDWLRQHGLLIALGKLESDHLRFKTTQAGILDALLDRQELIDVDAQFEQARQRLRHFEKINPVEPSPSFQGQLRSYQREGLGWLAFLREFGLGGILADDMGLGKTIQVLAMLNSRYEIPDAGDATQPASPSASPFAPQSPDDHKPTLIVVPRSVVFNWMDESARFAPKLRVAAYTGADRHQLRAAFKDHDVIVTSYGLMRRDIVELRKHQFDCIVLDEAQAIKNPTSQSAKAACLLQSDHRLVLTGTPIENHLGDLWSIFDFLNPGMLGSGARFAQMIRGEAARENDEDDTLAPPTAATAATANSTPATTDAADGAPPDVKIGESASRQHRAAREAAITIQVGRAIRPFILRRTKRQVLTDLPEKTEQTIYCDMEPAQRQVYDELRQHYRQNLLRKLKTDSDVWGSGGTGFMVLEALLRLRQAACHPALIDDKRQELPSAKLDVLCERLEELVEEGHKALVFSQFTSMLALVKPRLDALHIPYEYLDGQTRHRRTHVQRFQNDAKCPVFLISLKAGGLGLNLTAAEYVFILDPWWNPAVEAQAIDRTHRIGQTRHVFAYRLICKDTVEQRIAELQQQKKVLAEAIIGGQENLLRSLTRDELDLLLS